MNIRRARVEDAEAVSALWNHAIRDTLITFNTEERSTEAVAAEIDTRDRLFLVAGTGADVAGFATCGAFRPGPGYAKTLETTIMLSEEARGRGLGRSLMAALETEATATGAHVLVAAVSSANPGAVRFHERIGYQQAGVFREVGWKWGRWLDAIFLQKILGGRLPARD